VSAAAASVVIPTRNRKDQLGETLAAIFRQTIPLEVIVLDDGSTDGTKPMVRREFPEVVYHHFDGPLGCCQLRNIGSRLASAPILVPLDDDSVLVSDVTLEQTLKDFDDHRIGAVAIPFHDGPERLARQHPPDRDGTWVTSVFINASHAIRKEVFVGLGGYHPDWFYHYEELDLSLRMLQRGLVVRVGTADPIEHRASPARSFEQMDRYGRRNAVLFTWFNVPTAHLPLYFARITAKGVSLAASTRRPVHMARGFAEGWAELIRQRDLRRPVSPAVYRLHRRLQRRRAVRLAEIEELLPPLATRREVASKVGRR
jgi:hypothetical protein